MSAILFAGPSLWGSRRPLSRGLVLRPPAGCGDVLRAAAERPAAIGLVDGVFESGPSVWHKEILAAIAVGVPVLGAASLGALRAAELDRFGMIGVGAIYAAYRDGRWTRDDAVMVSHAPPALGSRPLTVALVDVAAAVAAAPPADRAALMRIAAAMNFRDRTWPALRARFAAATGRPLAPLDEQASLKRRDAEALIDRLAMPIAPPPCRPPPETVFLRGLRRRISS
ncbi:TfuA-like protein [Sphingomonas profundi]|uniref:TfuA-like protein n=1 Tax=Alterirhizorhabdus profundi TaxID=2681549 RepID=UPI0012E88EDE|nr:TfuA-like protein [Sphingomonas profundi]